VVLPVWLLVGGFGLTRGVGSFPGSQNSNPGELARTYSPKVAGKNGFRLLLRAFDLANSDERIGKLANLRATPNFSDRNVIDEIHGLDAVLALEKESLELPYDGASVTLSDPLAFPVFSYLKRIAKATMWASDGQFNHGSSGEATADLLLQIQVSHRLLPFSEISALVSIAVDAICYRGVCRASHRPEAGGHPSHTSRRRLPKDEPFPAGSPGG
jgi:hypothetical protein